MKYIPTVIQQFLFSFYSHILLYYLCITTKVDTIVLSLSWFVLFPVLYFELLVYFLFYFIVLSLFVLSYFTLPPFVLFSAFLIFCPHAPHWLYLCLVNFRSPVLPSFFARSSCYLVCLLLSVLYFYLTVSVDLAYALDFEFFTLDNFNLFAFVELLLVFDPCVRTVHLP